MVADSQTGPRQQVLFCDITDPKRPKLTRAFGDYGGIASGKPGEVAPDKFWGIRGIGMDGAGFFVFRPLISAIIVFCLPTAAPIPG